MSAENNYSLLPQPNEVFIQNEDGKPEPCVAHAGDLVGKLNSYGMVRGFKTYVRNGRERVLILFPGPTSLIIARNNGVYCRGNLTDLNKSQTLQILRDIHAAQGS